MIRFCERCGDFSRALTILYGTPRPPECHRVMPEMATLLRGATEEAHEELIRGLEHGLKQRMIPGKPFSRIIGNRFPKSSKKRTGSDNEQS